MTGYKSAESSYAVRVSLHVRVMQGIGADQAADCLLKCLLDVVLVCHMTLDSLSYQVYFY